ncbi:MnhB domain-containing protein [Xanthobacter agilis]|uniref:Multisubunit Na+/H+ antiporter MnhB subunit n=1 Tax=Xanthobacter agilis TaxID=47492 RepID=A0ABU0LE27_XANAG|nr:MnhB domain-containing protein [Xanthobacter agilis]MDQ0505373.1 multisubunit Na+/H+ antiporter MnhB subunit [Xanthobacter agilis]
MSLLLDAILALLVLAAAVRVAAGGDGFARVVAFMGVGLLLGLIWVRLAAVDVALTEVAVGSGITGLVLLQAAADAPLTREREVGLLYHLCAGMVGLVVFAALAVVVLLLPDPAPSLAPDVVRALPATDLGNPVTGVLLVFRALDTLLETMVLLVALIGVWSLSPDRHWRRAPAPLWPAPPSGALDFLARVLVPIGALVGIYMFWAGADVPGGAFQGGAVLAAMALMAMMAGLSPVPAIGGAGLRLAVLAGPFAFLGVGIAGWFLAGAFLDYPEGFEKTVIIAVEVAITVSIAVTLALLVLGPPMGRKA